MFGQIVDFLAIRVSIRITGFNASFAHIFPSTKSKVFSPQKRTHSGSPLKTEH